jgi:hypothetical protein
LNQHKRAKVAFDELDSFCALGEALISGVFDRIDDAVWEVAVALYDTGEAWSYTADVSLADFPLSVAVSIFHRVYSMMLAAEQLEDLRRMVLFFQSLEDEVRYKDENPRWTERLLQSCRFLREDDLDDEQ